MFRFKDYNIEELKNLRFFVPMRPFDVVVPGLGFGLKGSTTKEIPVVCKFVEEHYKLSDHYKCELIPADESLQPYFGKESYYQCDFEDLVNEDIFALKTSPFQHIEEVKWREYLTPTVYVEHSGYTIVD